MPSLPRVYLAGKISQNGWRSQLVPELRGAAIGQPIHCGRFIYGGPYFVVCDHGCAHWPGAHGLDANSCTIPQGAPARWTVPALCQHWLAQSDLLFAWIDGPDCFNTLVEIGWGQQLGLPVYVSFRNRSLASDMWFAGSGPLTRWSIDPAPAAPFEQALQWAARMESPNIHLPTERRFVGLDATERLAHSGREVACR